ncbi:DUF1801 domain-containing protein [Cognatiyoonia sp. IB215446]|uniref:DUF1801 domain-containing protein n=1 Tax=Cognatiyoonia sp. IB215446 TaxID=3097355 RepID=UPI002A1501ED|nr:DUF1801 domain-containing protein [Cognatiyoonia sp. IB215446]MDX8347858.1 DUF1801 domain-containing protein [Cognatiyoonia sp. IB215446]
MAENKTQPTEVDPVDFINAVEHPTRRADAQTLDALFRRVTGWQPKMWGPTIIGYGSYSYTYESGRSGEFLATGFSPRKANLSLYIMPGYADFQSVLDRLGKYKIGKSCLYINKLADVDLDVVEEIVKAGLEDLGQRWPVSPS